MKNKWKTIAIAAAAVIVIAAGYQIWGHYLRASNVDVCLLAGEGFVLHDRKTMIVTDAPFREGYPEDKLLSEDRVDKIMNALTPYDRVDLITISHKHIDHFDAEALLAHLAHNQDAWLLLPVEAAAELSAIDGAGLFADRIKAVTPERGKPETLVVNGVNVTVYNLDHRTEVENIGVLFDLDGKTYFHMGDFSAADFEANAIKDLHVDYLMVPYWYLRNDTNFALLKENMSWDFIIPMHIPKKDMPQEMIDRIGTWNDLMATMQGMDPNVILLTEEGMCASGLE